MKKIHLFIFAMLAIFGCLLLILFAKSSQAGMICCCDYFNMDEGLVNGYYQCQGMYVNPFWQVMRAMTTLKCYPIEDDKFDRYVWNRVFISDCNVDFKKVKHFRNVRLLQANHSRLVNVEAAWKHINILNINFSRNSLKEMPNFSGVKFGDSLDVSHNDIEAIDRAPVFSPSTRFIYLNNNRIRFINKKSFSNLYDLVEIHLEKNFLKQLAFEFDFVNGDAFRTDVFLNENELLSTLSGSE